jgi:hypothetical protein
VEEKGKATGDKRKMLLFLPMSIQYLLKLTIFMLLRAPQNTIKSHLVFTALFCFAPFSVLSSCMSVPIVPKPTSSIPSHSSRAKTDFLHFKPFQSGSNQFPPFQALQVGTSSIPSNLIRDKTALLHSKPFQAGQNRLLPFLRLYSPAKMGFLQTSHSSIYIVDKSSLQSPVLSLLQLVTELFSSC